jgi:hypothetical protein
MSPTLAAGPHEPLGMVPRPQGMVDELKIAGWGTAPADLSLGEDEVHVWRWTTRPSSAAFAQIMAELPEADRLEAERATGEKPKVFAARRFLLRTLVGRYLGEDPAGLRFEEDSDGHPRLLGGQPNHPHWDFAWGDTRAIFAVSASKPLAVHLEVVPKDFDVSALMAHVPPRDAERAQFLSPQSRARAVVGYYAEERALQRLGALLGNSQGRPDAQIERLRLGKRFVAALAAEGWGWSSSFWSFGELDEDDQDVDQ